MSPTICRRCCKSRTNFGGFFFGSLFSGVLTHDLRQSLPVYASHALRTTDADFDSQPYQSTRRVWGVPVFLCLLLALVVGYVISGMATLYVQYNVPATMDTLHASPLNAWGTQIMPQWLVLESARKWIPPSSGGVEPHSRLGHFSLGAAFMAGLSFMTIRFTRWPLHPIGFLLVYSLAIRWMWFSIFLGCSWRSCLVLRLGGGKLFRRARTFSSA